MMLMGLSKKVNKDLFNVRLPITYANSLDPDQAYC